MPTVSLTLTKTQRLSPEERAEDLLQQMTLKEKLRRCSTPLLSRGPTAPRFVLEKWAQDLNVGYVLVRTCLTAKQLLRP